MAPRLEEKTWPKPQVISSSGTAAQFHQRALPRPQRPQVWIHKVSKPALVLGSTQNTSLIDLPKASGAGFEITKRRSGGGLVLIDPEHSVWVDVVIAPGHPLWSDDVGRAFMWVGHAWAKGLSEAGLINPLVHSGPATDPELGRLLCFGSTGSGEVSVGGAKVVGLSQRRTRDGARFQGIAHQRWDPATLQGFVDPEFSAAVGVRGDQLRIGADFDRGKVRTAVVDSLLEALSGGPVG